MRINKFFLDFRYDYCLLLIVSMLVAIGLLLLASASMSISARYYNHPFHFLVHQAISVCIGVGVMFMVIRIPLIVWEKIGVLLLLLSIFLLLLVLLPGVGREVNGSVRWLGWGPLNLQVSEFSRFAVIVYMAGYLVRCREKVKENMDGFIKPLLLLGLTTGLLILEPDFGAAMVTALTVFGMLFLAGARLRHFILMLLLIGGVFWVLAVTSPYRLARLTSFINPWASPFDSGYQLTQSLIAFGRGGIFGVGLGNGIQKLFYLPEAHTDFLFAILAEEFGIIGQLCVIALFVAFVGRVFYLARLAVLNDNKFGSYLAYGLGLLLSLQVVINIGVNVGLLPTKGLTLPFISYGGSSMLFTGIIVAMLLRLYHELDCCNLPQVVMSYDIKK